MAGEPVITIIGNATSDAELKFLPSGVAVCSFTVAQTPRVKQGDSWIDGEATFYRCSVWRQMAESVAETVTKGMRLVVHGRLKTRSYESNGEKRISIELDVEEVGPSLRYATATVNKVARDGSGQQQRQNQAAPQNDPWNAAPADAPPPF